MSLSLQGNNFLRDVIRKWWIEDLEKAICAGSNYLAALGLSEYSEILGKFLLEHAQKPNKKAEDRYTYFLKLMDKSIGITHYQDIDNRLRAQPQVHNKKGLYGRVRCGLAHEYFILGRSEIFRKKNEAKHGIEYDEVKDYIWFCTAKYLEEFIKTIDYIDSNYLLSNIAPIVVKISGEARVYVSNSI